MVHVVYAFGTGGMEKGIAAVIAGSSPEFRHTVVCLKSTGESQRLLPQGTPVLSLDKPPGNSLRFVKTLAHTLRRLEPQVVHTRNWGGTDGIVAAKLAGIRNVVHGVHGWDMTDPHGRNKKRILFRRFASRWVSEYTCVSKQMELWLRDTIRVRKAVTQIYNGVDTVTCSPENEGAKKTRAELGIPSDAFVIGTVGRLDPIKDHPALFRAFNIVQQKAPNTALVVVGDGVERKRLEALAGEGVVFLGNRLDVPELLRIFDVFVLTSKNEGISNTILEAMATAVPVVATNVGGNPELVKDGSTGFLVKPGDFESMASALVCYFEDPDLRIRHGKAGRDKAIKEFGVQKMVRSYEEVYRRASRTAKY